ncbi:MAG TPA: hypothetical protein VF735_19970 [Pyrinomonadaceae bacterium]
MNIALVDRSLMQEEPIEYAAPHDIVHEKSTPRPQQKVDGALGQNA